MAPKDASNIATQLLSRAHSPATTDRLVTERVKQRPLHLKPTEPNNAQHQRRVARLHALSTRRKKQKPKPLSARQKRGLCLYEIPKEQQKYEIYKALHEMWVGYIQEVLGLMGEGSKAVVTGNGGGAKLASADFHGAEVEVVRSRCVSRVGIRGIVVKDTRFTFEIITKTNTIKVVPKEHTVFRFALARPSETADNEGLEQDKGKGKDLVFELHGDQFKFRASDRANKKFKHHFLKDI